MGDTLHKSAESAMAMKNVGLTLDNTLSADKNIKLSGNKADKPTNQNMADDGYGVENENLNPLNGDFSEAQDNGNLGSTNLQHIEQLESRNTSPSGSTKNVNDGYTDLQGSIHSGFKDSGTIASAAPVNFENEKSGILTETRNEESSKSMDFQNADLGKASKYADCSNSLAKKLVVRTVEKVDAAECPASVGAKHPTTFQKINAREYEIAQSQNNIDKDNDYNEEIRSKRDLLDTMEVIQPLEDTREADCYGR
uniref:Uncharacterized protein n=1 Tax=Cacopsylla melanoneura TaxID=428564 RepID=A0A8D9BJ74_9HEMI